MKDDTFAGSGKTSVINLCSESAIEDINLQNTGDLNDVFAVVDAICRLKLAFAMEKAACADFVRKLVDMLELDIRY